MKKYTTAPHRKLLISCGLIGFGLMIAAAAPVTSAFAEPKQAEIRFLVQSNESQNKEIVREGFAKWANNTGSFFDLLVVHHRDFDRCPGY